MKQVLLKLPDDLGDRLQLLADREHQTPEATAEDILRRGLHLNRFLELCRESRDFVGSKDYYDEDDVLRDVS